MTCDTCLSPEAFEHPLAPGVFLCDICHLRECIEWHKNTAPERARELEKELEGICGT